jgi:hypothetical protein
MRRGRYGRKERTEQLDRVRHRSESGIPATDADRSRFGTTWTQYTPKGRRMGCHGSGRRRKALGTRRMSVERPIGSVG